MSDDIELQLPEDSSSDHDPKTVKELLHECERTVELYSMRYYAQAQYNERMITGDQKFMLDQNWQLIEDQWGGNTPFTSRNLLRNLSLTWSSRLLEERPNLKCYPAEPGADQKKAEVCDKILEYVRQNQDWDDICFNLANLVQPHSVVGLKVVWDPLSGPVSQGIPVFDDFGAPVLDENGNHIVEGVGEILGDVRWNIVTLFDYGTDGAENIEDSKWVYFTKIVDKWDAIQLLRSAGIEDKEPDVRDWPDVWQDKKTGVKITELWWKPDYRFPKGLYAVLVGDVVVQAIDYPYKHLELPVAVWKAGPRRNNPYGSTHVDDAVYIQRTINETVAAMARQARQVRDIKLIGPKAIIDAIEEGNQMIPCNDVGMIQATRYLEPPDLARSLQSTLADNTQALYAVFGLNELLTGADTMKSGTAAKSIAYLNKLDGMKMAGAARSFNKFVMRAMRQTLKLYQQYVKAPRLASIAGSNDLYDSFLFLGSDISGVDVRLEPITGFDLMRANKVESAQTAMMQGNQDPQIQAQAKTGLAQSAFDKSQREVVQAQIRSVLRNEPVEPDLTIDSNIAVDELMTVLSQYHNTAYGPMFKQLIMQYMQSAPAQQQEDQQIQQIEGGGQ